MDHIVVGIGTKATYNMMLEAGYSQNDALSYARKISNISQPNADPGALPAVWRSNESVRLSLAFGQQITKIWNMLTYESEAAIKNRDFGALVGNLLAIQASTAMIALATHRRFPEEPEEFATWMLYGNTNYIPVIGRMLVAAHKGYDPSSLFANTVLSGKDALTGGSKVVSSFWNGEDTGDTLYKEITKNLPGLGVLTGLPGGAAQNIVQAFEEGDLWELVGGQSERE